MTDKLNSAYTQSFTYDSLNRLASATETRWGMNYVYDAWGNYLQQNLTLGSGYQHQYVANGNNQLSGYSYDANGNMLSDGFHQYDYNAENQILDVDSYTDSYTYDAEGNRERKDAGGQPSTEYVYFNGEVIAEKNTSTEDWSEYIYASGKRIAKAVDFEDRILIQGTNCSGCGSQYTGFTINGISWLPYVIQTGDRVMLRQKTNSGLGGVVLYFSDGSSTRNVAADSDGQLLNSDGMTGYFHYRTADLSAYAGKTLASIALISETTSGAGPWLLKYADFVLISADGTVQPIYTNETTVSLSQFGSSGVTGVSGGVDHVSSSSDPTNTTWYYHGDQIGSSRLMTANEGWPVWQGTFLPYGEEYNPQITTNNYKFTGKERDSETGLDYFGARYYGNGLGRWMSPDWASTPVPVPYADLTDPQSLNQYSYVRNLPTTKIDRDGHGFWHKLKNWWTDGGWTDDDQQAQAERQRRFHNRAEEARKILSERKGFTINGKSPADFAKGATDQQAIAGLNLANDFVIETAGRNFFCPAGVSCGIVFPLGDSVNLTDTQGATHILDGDATGGGHRGGTGISGKSEFPTSWSDEKILHEISDIATDPASARTKFGVTEVVQGTRDGITIKVIIRDGRIVTGYPTNVPRNP